MSTKTLLLSHRDLRWVVRRVGLTPLMDELIARLGAAFATFDERTTAIPVRTGFHYDRPATGLIEWMPLMQRHREVVMKIVGYHPDNPQAHGLPTILSTITAYDTATGHLTAVADGTLLTAMRTGAASAVSSRLLASPASRTLGLIGCGAQAVTQLHALSRVFALDEVLLCDVDPAALRSFPARVAGLVPSGIELRSCPAEEVVAGSDILSVATSVEVGRGPVFAPCESKPWLHVNAVGSDFPGKTELPLAFLQQCFVCPDTVAQARVEGECQQLQPAEIGAGIVDVARKAESYRSAQSRRTVFDSTGWALEDQVALDLVLEHARALGLGSEMQIESVGHDPRDPYELVGDDGAAT